MGLYEEPNANRRDGVAMRRDERILIDPLLRTATRFAENAGGSGRRESERELFDRLSRLARNRQPRQLRLLRRYA